MDSSDTPDDTAPAGWATAETSDDVRSWLGSEERVICIREADRWMAYSQPRGELGTSHQVMLTSDPTSLDRAVTTAIEYMEQYEE